MEEGMVMEGGLVEEGMVMEKVGGKVEVVVEKEAWEAETG